MKLPAVLLLGSLALNAALVATFTSKPSLAPPAFRNFFAGGRSTEDKNETSSSAATARLAAEKKSARQNAWTELDPSDLPGLIARLRAAGFPPAIIRAIVSSEVEARYIPRIRALTDPDPSIPFWKATNSSGLSDPAKMAEYTRLMRERNKATRDLLNEPALRDDAAISADQRRRFGNISQDKIDQVQRVLDDYDDMTRQARAVTQNSITLPEDREKLLYLEKEKHNDLASILAPAELEDFELRNSPITQLLTSIVGNFSMNESEFRTIFAASKAFSDELGGNYNVVDPKRRQELQQQMTEQLKSGLGEQRYDDYTRATDREFQQLSRLAQSASLAPETALQVYNTRKTVSEESNRIFNDAALTVDQKRAALQSLGQNTRAQLLATLGPTAGPAYVKTADNWLRALENGGSFTLNNSSGTISNGTVVLPMGTSGVSTRRLPPAGAPMPPPPASTPRG